MDECEEGLLQNNLFDQYIKEIKELQDDEDKTKYCALFLLIVYNGCLSKKVLTPDGASRMGDILKEFGIFDTSILYIFEQLKAHVYFFVKATRYITTKLNTYDEFVPIDDKIFDFVCYYYGKHNQRTFIKFSHTKILNGRTQFISLQEKSDGLTVMITRNNENAYFNRIVNDLLKGCVTEVVYNQQMKFPTYRSALINFMENLDAHTKLKVVNATSTESGSTFFMHAYRESYGDITQFLIKENADTNIANFEGQSTMRIACYDKQIETVDIFLKNGANPNACFDDGWTLLTEACYAGNLEVAKLLINAGAEVNHVNGNGETPVTSCVVLGHFEVMKLLTDNGATLNTSNKLGVNSLTSACFYGHIKLVRFLISKDVDINEADANSWTPLMYASLFNHNNIMNLLLANGAKQQCI